jgi:site-specific DNA-methyltransferase (adenine-specific)
MLELNKVYLGDCLDVMATLPDESIDCIVTDCPYHIIAGGVRIEYAGDECKGILNKRDYSKTDPKDCLNRGKIVVSDGTVCSNKWLKKGDVGIPSATKNGKMFEHNDIKFSEWLPEVFRVLKKGSHCYIMINGRNLSELQSDAEKVGFEYQNLLAWVKNNATPNKYYMQGMEFILMLSKRPAKNINNMGTKNYFQIPNIIGNKVHPSEKPVDLMAVLIENSTLPNEIVLDPFGGGCPVAVACINLNRQYICIEKDELYFDIANERINNLVRKETLL